MSKPYSNDAQIFTFGIHGTNNDPSNVREVAGRISVAVGETTDGANLFDNGFSWKAQYTPGRNHPVAGTAYTTNGTSDREIASQRFAAHVLQQVDKAIERGTLDRDKALTINLVGFSHGGNVAILASDEISEGLKRRGINSAIHLTTLSTPAYTWGDESPTRARELVQADGVKFAHTHFSTPGDGVIRAAFGNSNYDNGFTRDINFRNGVSNHDGIANHGAVQDRAEYMNTAAAVMRQRFNGLAPAQLRSDASSDLQVANVTPGTPGSGNIDWDKFNNNPLVQQASAALNRSVPEVQPANQNPSLLASIAGAAAESRLGTIQDLSFSQNQQTAFVTDRDKNDPSARVAPVDLTLAHKPTQEVMQKYAAVLDNAQTPPVASQDPEQQRKQSNPSIA
jgi:hypothetical protein